MPDQRHRPHDPTTRVQIEERAIFTLPNGEEVIGYLRSFKDDDGTWGAWNSRLGAFRAVAVRRI